MDSVLSLTYEGRLAIITIDNDKKLNALSSQQYYELARKLTEIATHDEVYITLIIGKGRFFSAGADVGTARSSPGGGTSEDDLHQAVLRQFAVNNLYATRAFFTHPKILVVGLNGPVVGLSAALTALADFVYAVPSAYLLTPFSSLGLAAEGGASRALVQRLGISKANEALIMSKRISADELLAAGFVNKVFTECGKGDHDKFRALVLKEIDERLGGHLVGKSLIEIKALIRGPERDALDTQNVKEVFALVDRFMSGVPQAEFAKIASGQKRHKL